MQLLCWQVQKRTALVFSVYFLYLTVGMATALCVSALVALVPGYAKRYREYMELQAAQSLSELFLFMPARSLLSRIALLAVGFAVLMGLLSNNVLLAVMCGIMGWLMPWCLLRNLRARRQRAFHQQLPDALLLLSSGLRSGRALTTAIQVLCKEMPAPLAQEFTLLQRQVRLGQTLETALDALFLRLPSVDLERVIIALKLAQESGGQQAALLEQLSVTMRSKQQLQQRIIALTAQGRLQGKVMTALPVLMGAALWLIEKPTMLALSRHPVGWAAGIAIVALLAGGYWVIRKQVHIEVPL